MGQQPTGGGAKPNHPPRSEGGTINVPKVAFGMVPGRNRPEPTVPELVAAGLTATQAAAHVERIAELALDRDMVRADIEQHTRITADQRHYQEGYRAGTKVGAAQQSARDLDEGWETTETLRPEAYDVADRALDYATRLVEPIKSAPLVLDEEFGPVTSAYVRLTTELAAGLYGWLTQFTEPDPPDGPSLAERFVPAANGPRCPQPECGVLLDASGACTDPWCPSGGAVVGDPVVIAGPEPVEQQSCPECRQGKHDNCPGRVLDEAATDDTGVPTYLACPCAVDTHPESLG